jgi:hypothetical protein
MKKKPRHFASFREVPRPQNSRDPADTREFLNPANL